MGTNVEDTFYIIGSSVGPHPYPMLVRDFQSVIGTETKKQFKDITNNELPDRLVACVGGGSNALGLFYPFIDDDVKIVGVEAAGKGIDTNQHAATLTKENLEYCMVQHQCYSKVLMVKLLYHILYPQVWIIQELVQSKLSAKTKRLNIHQQRMTKR